MCIRDRGSEVRSSLARTVGVALRTDGAHWQMAVLTVGLAGGEGADVVRILARDEPAREALGIFDKARLSPMRSGE
eukprot:1045862-Alexandrium_andersonii.AAC.1